MSELFPFDYDALKKGDVIPQVKIEQIYLKRRSIDPDGYRLKMMHLCQEIESRRPDLIPRCDKATVRIMLDGEADNVTHDRIVKAIGSIGRNATRRGAINRGEFSEQQRKVAEHRDGFATVLMISTRKELAKASRDARLLGGSIEPTDAEE